MVKVERYTSTAFLGEHMTADPGLARDAAQEGQHGDVAVAGAGGAEQVLVDHRRPSGEGVQVAQESDQRIGHRAVEARRQRNFRRNGF